MADDEQQTSPDAPAKGGGFGWSVILGLIAIVAVAVYFQPHIDRFFSTPDTTVTPPKQELAMALSSPAPTLPKEDTLLKQQVESLILEMKNLREEKAALEGNLLQTQQSVSEMEARLTIAEANAKQQPTTPAQPEAAVTTPVPAAATPEQAQEAETLKKQIADLQVKLSEQAKLMAEVQMLKSQLDSRAFEIEKIADQLSSEKQISTYEQQEAWKQVAALIYFDRFKTSILAGKSFAPEYDELYESSRDNAKAIELIAKFKPYQEKGIPTLADITSMFPNYVNAALFQGKPVDDSVWSSIKHNLSGLVTVRKVGGRAGEDAESVIARAEEALNAGKLEDAVKEIESLKGEALVAFAPWLERAKLRAGIIPMLDELKAAIVKPTDQTMFYER